VMPFTAKLPGFATAVTRALAGVSMALGSSNGGCGNAAAAVASRTLGTNTTLG